MNEYQKYQEALDRIGSDATNYHLSFSTLSSVIISQEKETMADRELLQELVDKEKPRYVNYEYDGYADGCPVYDTARCPECGRYFDLDCEEKCNYCPDCGQRLNWDFRELEDEEEEI